MQADRQEERLIVPLPELLDAVIGDAADLARAEPVLARISVTRNVIGNNEQATVMKLCGNLQISAQMEAMCEALDLPLLGRVPFDRKLAKTFDKGQPLLDEAYPTIQRYQEIAGRIRTLLDYKKVLADKL